MNAQLDCIVHPQTISYMDYTLPTTPFIHRIPTTGKHHVLNFQCLCNPVLVTMDMLDIHVIHKVIKK